MDLEFGRRFKLEAYPEKRRLIRGYLLLALLALLATGLGAGIWSQTHRATEDRIALRHAADSIQYLDEVLTLSARMAAATGEEQWQTRYHAAARHLDDVLVHALIVSPRSAEALNQISTANARLLGRESQALSLLNAGKPAEADALLRDVNYLADKSSYAAGLQGFLSGLQRAERDANALLHQELTISALLLLALLLLMGFVLYSNHRLLVRRIELEQALGVVARRLINADASQLDSEIQSVLRLLAARAAASQVWLLQAQEGPLPRLLNSWFHASTTENRPDPRALTAALLACQAGEQGILTLGNGAAADWERLGITALEGVALDLSKQRFVLVLIGLGGSPLRWNHRESAILQSIGEVLVRAIENRRLQERLLHLATTDGLTGLLNRRQFIEVLQRERSRAGDAPLPTALLMLDIDHFKAINDRHGHATGDAVLVALGGLLRKHLRDIDILGRIGGEEFAVLLPGTDNEGARDVAERLRTAVADATLPAEGHDIRLTVSVGATLIDRRDADAQASLKRADLALYAAKDAGRNRVEYCPAA